MRCSPHQRTPSAKQFKRDGRSTTRAYLGRTARDIVRKIRDESELEALFAHPL